MRKIFKNKYCIDNYIIFILIICLIFLIAYIYNNNNNILFSKNFKKVKFNENNNQYYFNESNNNNHNHLNHNHLNHNHLNHNHTSDVLLNPYSPPLRDNRINNNNDNNNDNNYNSIPINIPTQSVDTNYRQIGLLTRVNGPETILPLMGRPLFTNRDKWNFYTMNDKNNMIKLPITFKNKSCTSEQGCDNLYDGDTVYVEGYSDIFRVTMYDNNTLRYIPSL